jgi:hypothetical protein
VFAAPAAIAEEPALTVEVATAVASAPAQVAVFSYRHFDVPRSDTRTNASPLAIAVDDRSRVAVNEEFHTQLKRLDAAIGWEVFDLPRGPTENIFAAHFVADNPTRLSMLGESIVVDPSGRTWATEGGWMLYAGVYPNHSRIVMLEPDGGRRRSGPSRATTTLWSVSPTSPRPAASGSPRRNGPTRGRRHAHCLSGAPHEFRSARDSAGRGFLLRAERAL